MAADAKAAPAKPAAAGGAKPAGGGGGGASKGKKDKKAAPVVKQPESGRKFGHGAKDRPSRADQRAAAAAAAVPASPRDVDADGNILTDDEAMQPLLQALNEGRIDLERGADDPRVAALGPAVSARVETIEERVRALSTAQYMSGVEVPDEFKGRVSIVDDDFDAAAQSEVELSEEEVHPALESDALSAWTQRKGRPGVRSYDDGLPRIGAAHVAEVTRARRAQAADTVRAAAASSTSTAARRARLEVTAAAHDRDEDARAKATRVNDGLASLISDDDEGEVTLVDAAERRGEVGKAGVKLPTPEELSEGGAAVDSEEGVLMQRPPLIRSRRSMLLPNYKSEGEEVDAMHREQAAGMLGAATPPAAGMLNLSDDDDVDAGGDDLDPRFRADRITLYRDYKARLGLADTDSDIERLLEVGVEERDGTRMNGMFGDGGVEKVPPAIIEELANPTDLYKHTRALPYPVASTVREATMTPEERVIDEQRKALRDLIEKPLPVVNRPLWPTYAMIGAVDQVHQVVAGGMVASTRCLIIVGNGHGGAGFGIGKHKEPFQATKQALANAQRDMVHVSTHKGQLYHDLIGKKNSLRVIIRTLPSSTHHCHAPLLIQEIFEMTGIKHASAKIVGSKGRNPFNVVQAVFDAFNHHYPPEEAAFARGLRMQWIGADRLNPRSGYPMSPTGPRFPAANERFVSGKWRA